MTDVTSSPSKEPEPATPRDVANLPNAQRDLLYLACYLAPGEEIPYAVLSLGAEFLSDSLRHVVIRPDLLIAMFKELAARRYLLTRKHSFVVPPEILHLAAARQDRDSTLAWANAAYRCLERAYSRSQTGEAILLLAPHIRALGNHAQRAGLPLFPVSTLIYSAGLFLHEHKRSADAIPLIRNSIDLCLLLGDENHPLIATRTNSLGLAYQGAGKPEYARECFERALGICEHVFGPTEKAIYTSSDERFLTHPLRNLCRVLQEMDEPDAIQAAYDRALAVYLHVHGPYHPLVAECANDMGHIWHEMGNLDKAAFHFEKAIESESKSKKPVAGNLAAYCVNLGTVRLQQELVEEAEGLYRRALELDSAEYGLDSPAVGRDLAGLGEVLRQQDLHEEALASLENAMRIAEAQQPQDPAEMRLLAANMGRVASSLRDHNRSVSYHRRALELSLSIHGRHAPQTSRDYFSLARALLYVGLAEDAIEHFEHALEIEVALNGEEHERCATVLVNLGEAYEHAEDYTKAKTHYAHALRIDKHLFGDEHENVARDLYRVGSLLGLKGDTVSAIATLNRALAVTEHTLGRDHSRARKIRRKLTDLSSGQP